ncbi:MAG: HD domain-containing protein [Deltaproteobacteria bacterium]
MPFLSTRFNEIHTFIVYQYALLLLQEEPALPEVVIPASILHDVGWSVVPEEEQLKAFGPVITNHKMRRKHEVEGAVIARKILNELAYDPGLIPRMAEIIEDHDTYPDAKSLDDAVTKDADKLFRVSHAGFRIDNERFGADPLARIENLIREIDNWFLTKTGKEMARHEAHMRKKEIREIQVPAL